MRSDAILDIVCAAIFLAFGLALHFLLIDEGIPVPASLTIASLSPDFWPRLVAKALIVISAVLVLQTLIVEKLFRKRAPETLPEPSQPEGAYRPIVGLTRALALMAAMFGFYFALPTLGLVVSSIILIVAMMLFFGEGRLLLVAILGIAVPTCLYLFFRYAAGIPIPLGIFEG